MKQHRTTLKNAQQERKQFSRRSIILFIIMAALLMLLVIRLLWLQILQYEMYQTLSNQNQMSYLPIEPKRGLILDRHGNILAENLPVFSLEIVPQHVTNIKQTIASLQQILDIQPEDIQQFYKQLRQKRAFPEVPLLPQLTEQELAIFSVNQYRFPGVVVRARMMRHYPYGESFAHVLGYMGRINEHELAKIDAANYAASNYIGKLGIEKYYENILHGQTGYQHVEIDASGRIVRTLKRIAPMSGDNLYLSIDVKLQMAAEHALGKNRGAVVAIDPNNGQILAAVSNPSYDPNLFVRGLSNQAFATLKDSPDQPLYNRVLRGQYALASTIKPFMGLAGLELGIITPDTEIYDPGWVRVKDNQRKFHDWKRDGHGYVDITKALAESCDTYFFMLALKMGIVNIDAYLKKFGFGQLTGVDVGEEVPGLVANPEWKNKKIGLPWFPGDTLNSVIGQGYMLATPLQLAHATSILAMRGRNFTPSFLFGRESEGGIVMMNPPQQQPFVEMDEDSWDVVHEGMEQVVQSPVGTARKLRPLRYSLAAKTGTGQVYSLQENEIYNKKKVPEYLRDNGSFIAFAPIEKPKIAIAVVTEHNEQALYVAKEVIDAYLLQ